MKSVILVLFVAALVYAYPTVTRSQTNWTGGGGIEGPVYSWGSSFWEDTLVTVLSGEISLTTTYDPLQHNVHSGTWECVISADMDGDGDMDIVASDLDSSVRWWENTNGDGLSWTMHTVNQDVSTSWVDAGDVDGDGDVDLMTAYFDYSDNAFYWWENTDGTGSSWQKHTIGGQNMTQPNCVRGADVDGDGDLDVIGSSDYDGYIELFINTDGAGGSWSASHLDPNQAANYIAPVDFEGDGDIDLAVIGEEEICWYENDGTGTVWTSNLVSDVSGRNLETVSPADIDGDGDMDLVYAGTFSRVGWYENTDGEGTDWSGHFLPNCHTEGAMAAAAADMNGDGTVDIVAGFDWANTVEWWSNESGTGNTWTHYSVDEMNLPYSFCIADIDGDGIADPVGGGTGALRWWNTAWEPLTGTLTSSILDKGYASEWGMLMWEADIHTGNSVSFQVRGSLDSTNMGAWSDTLFLPCDLKSVLADSGRFIQYKTILQRVDDTSVPALTKISVSYVSFEPGFSSGNYGIQQLSGNPSSYEVVFAVDIPLQGNLKATLYDVSGRLISVLQNYDQVSEGIYHLWAYDIRPGLYFLRVESGFWSDVVSFTVIE